MPVRPKAWAIVALVLAVCLVQAAGATAARGDGGPASSHAQRTFHNPSQWLDALGGSSRHHRPASGDDTFEDAQDSLTGDTPGLSADHHALSTFDAPPNEGRAQRRPDPEPYVTRLLSTSRELAAPRPPPAV